MSKKGLFKRGIALLLSIVMAFGLAIPVSAAENETPGTEEGTAVTDRILGADRKFEAGEATGETANPDEEVRVSIVLEKPSTIEKGFSTIGIAQNATAMSYRDQLYREQETLQTKIEAEALDGAKLDVVWNLTLAANIISANVKRGEIEAIEKVAGVKSVFVERQYSPDVVSVGGGVSEPQMAVSAPMTGATGAWDSGYTGAGMKIAIIDTGIDAEHQSFDEGAFNYSLSTRGFDLSELMDAGDIADVFDRLNISGDSGVSASVLFRSNKIAYGWNYVDHNSNISHLQDIQGEHGSHVAGIAAANKYIPDGSGGYKTALDSVFVQGVAPDAQLLVMKVFGAGGGAEDSDTVAAIEDAILLGADSVNLSLGVPMAGMASPFEGDPYAEIQETLINSDTVVVYSGGNAGAWADYSAPGNLYNDGVSFATCGESGSYTNSFAVASVDNKGFIGPSIEVGGTRYSYNDTSSEYIPSGKTFGETLDPENEGTEYPFIMLDAETAGSEVQALKALQDAGVDFTGKIIIVHRGVSNFSAKATAINEVGASGGIVANNQVVPIRMDLTGYSGDTPVISILQVDSQEIFASGTPTPFTYTNTDNKETQGSYVTGELTVNGAWDANMDMSVGNTMSSYSSWGTTGDLALKPEITAPGGSIYSVWGANASAETSQDGHDAYELMSGTSMAAPQVTGIAALVQQAIEQKGYDQGMTDRALTMALLMSTATPLSDADGMIFSMLQQGAGLVNAQAALSTPAYITVDGRDDGKVKVELGDDPDKTGEYGFSFTVHNLTGENIDYAFDAEVLTQLSQGGYLLGDTTPIKGAEVKFYVNGEELSNSAEEYESKYDYNNDRKVTKEDAQMLLDSIMGNGPAPGTDKDIDLNDDGAVNTYDVHLHLNLTKVYATVPANGEVTVEVEITGVALDETLYPAGGYVEAYISGEAKATEEGVLYPALNLPVLAYYGNWTSPSMYEIGSNTEWWDAYQDDSTSIGGRVPYTAPFIFNGTGNDGLTNIIFEGTYPYIDGDSIGSDAGSLEYRYTPIRNSGNGVVQVTYKGADGKDHVAWRSDPLGPEYGVVYYENIEMWLRPDLQGNLYYSLFNKVEIDWASAVENFPEGTEEVTISLIRAPEYYAKYDYDWDILTDGDTSNGELGEGAILSTTLEYDPEPPVIVSTDLRPDDEPPTLTVTVKDNVSVIDITLMDSEGNPVQELNPIIADWETDEPIFTATGADEETTVVFDGYHRLISFFGMYFDYGKTADLEPDLYTLIVSDSAGNETTEEILFGMEPTNVAETLEVNTEEIEILVGSTAQLEAAVGPVNLTDKGVKWASADEDIATVDENGLVTAVAKGETTITVTTNANGPEDKPLTKEVKVTVITIPVTATGALGDTTGHAKMFTWNFETNDLVYDATSEEDETVYPSALTRYKDGTILVVDGEGTMYQLPADGALTPLGTSAEGAYTRIPFDMTYSANTGFWWTYNGYLLNETDPLAPEMFGFNFGNSYGTIFAIANTDEHWEYEYQGDLLSGDSVIYRLTDAGALQITLLYNGGDNALTLSLRLGIDTAFEGFEGQPYSNMVLGEDGALYISIMRHNTNEVYQLAFINDDGSYMRVKDLLEADSIGYSFIPMDDFGDDVWPALFLDVKSNPAAASLDVDDTVYGTAVTGEASVIDVSAMEIQTFTAEEIAAASSDDSAETAGTTTVTGTLNSIEVPADEQVDDSGIVIDEANHTVTVPVDAISTTNGRFTLKYDPEVLTLVDLTEGSSMLTSVVTDETAGTIDVGFAAKNKVTALAVKAVFQYAPSTEDVTTTLTLTATEDGMDKDGQKTEYPLTLPGEKTAYDVTITLDHGTSDAPKTATEGEDLTFTLTPDDGYKLPSTITVTVDGRVLDPSEYSYDPATGKVTIPGEKITGPVSVSATFPVASAGPGTVIPPVDLPTTPPSNVPQQTPGSAAKPSPEDTPKTGDATPVALLATMMVLSAAAAGFLVVQKRKRK